MSKYTVFYISSIDGKHVINVDETLLKSIISESRDYSNNISKYSKNIKRYQIKRTANIDKLKQYVDTSKYYLEIQN